MPRIPFATGARKRKNAGLQNKLCKNAFIERSGTDPTSEIQIVTRWGSLGGSWPGSDAVRGYTQADGFAGGKIIAVVGNALKTYDPDTQAVGTIPGFIAGTDRVRWANTETELGILADGKPYFSDGTTVHSGLDTILDDPNLAIGSTTSRVATGAFDYRINGVDYSKGAVVAGTVPGNDVIPLGKFGAVALEIAADGTIDAIEAPANATGYTTAAEAAAALPSIQANHIRIGYVTASKSDGTFTFGTTALNAANTTVAYSDAEVMTGYQDLLDDHTQTAFIDIVSIGQRFLLLYGSRFCYSDVLNGRSTNVLNYYTGEFSPDGFVGAVNANNRVYFFGTSTTEPWEETGVSDNPFRRSLGQEFAVGCRARDTIRLLDTVPYWVDQHNQLRRLGNALVPDTLSEPDLAKEIAATDVDDMLAFTLEFEGHAMYGLRLPTLCRLYDANYNEFCDFETNLTSTWRYGYALRVKGQIYVGDAVGRGFAYMAEAYKSEHMPDASTMGAEIVGYASAYIPTERARRLGRLRLEGSKGIGLATGQGSDPQISMRRSLRGPGEFSSWVSRSLGRIGEYFKNVWWNQMGMVWPPGCTIEFRWSDPVAPVLTGLYEDA